MVTTNLLKGGGAFLLSCCRGAGAATGSPRPQLVKCCLVNGNRNVLSISSIVRRPESGGSSGRVFHCTTAFQNVVVEDSSSSSSPETTPSSSASASASAADDDAMVIRDAANSLDIRVGHVLKAWAHPEADSLYVEEVDVGEPEPRIICSGLVNYMPLDLLQGKKVIVLANLKPRNMRGIKSCGMLMAASDASHENVELLVPPEDSLPGERVWFGSSDEKENLPDAVSPNQIQKKKIWEMVQPHLKTDASCVATLGTHFMRTSAGVVVCKSLKNANIS